MIMQTIKQPFAFGSRRAMQPVALVACAHRLILVMLLGRLHAHAQVPANESEARAAPRRAMEEKLNATRSRYRGSPEDTYLDITHDLAVVLTTKTCAFFPSSDGGAQNIRDVLYLKASISGSRPSQMLRYSHRRRAQHRARQRLNYITRLYRRKCTWCGRNIQKLEDLNGKKVNFSRSWIEHVRSRRGRVRAAVGFRGSQYEPADAIAGVKKGNRRNRVISGNPPSYSSALRPAHCTRCRLRGK